MARHFAQLDHESVVIRVIVADSMEWVTANLPGRWVETIAPHDPASPQEMMVNGVSQISPHRSNYAAIGSRYDVIKDNFV